MGTCQPFPMKISVTELDAEGFQEAQAPKQKENEVDFIHYQGRRSEIFFRSRCMLMTRWAENKQEREQTRSTTQSKHNTNTARENSKRQEPTKIDLGAWDKHGISLRRFPARGDYFFFTTHSCVGGEDLTYLALLGIFLRWVLRDTCALSW